MDIVLAFLGILMLVWWGNWWYQNLSKNEMQPSPPVWLEPFKFLGLDFLHNYQAARHWLHGGNPYQEPFGDPLGRKLCYPPIVLPLFSWCALVSPRKAVIIWTFALAGFASSGAWAAWRCRARLGLYEIPLPFAIACIVMSGPVCYAMERGNYDLMVLPLLIIAAGALQNKSWSRDTVAGTALALATCLKIYPGLVILSLIPLRRGRPVVISGVAGIAFMAFGYDNLPKAQENLKELAHLNRPDKMGTISPCNHSLSGSWKLLWKNPKQDYLKNLSGNMATALLLGPVMLLVSYRLWRTPHPEALILPTFLWVAGVGTYVPAVANDYSLFYIPLVALAVWDRRDPVWVHLLMATLILWAQPVAFAISPRVLFGLKVIAVYGTAACLLNRIRDQAAVAMPTQPVTTETVPSVPESGAAVCLPN